jgi:hypothetical protein
MNLYNCEVYLLLLMQLISDSNFQSWINDDGA